MTRFGLLMEIASFVFLQVVVSIFVALAAFLLILVLSDFSVAATNMKALYLLVYLITLVIFVAKECRKGITEPFQEYERMGNK